MTGEKEENHHRIALIDQLTTNNNSRVQHSSTAHHTRHTSTWLSTRPQVTHIAQHNTTSRHLTSYRYVQRNNIPHMRYCCTLRLPLQQTSPNNYTHDSFAQQEDEILFFNNILLSYYHVIHQHVYIYLTLQPVSRKEYTFNYVFFLDKIHEKSFFSASGNNPPPSSTSDTLP